MLARTLSTHSWPCCCILSSAAALLLEGQVIEPKALITLLNGRCLISFKLPSNIGTPMVRAGFRVKYFAWGSAVLIVNGAVW